MNIRLTNILLATFAFLLLAGIYFSSRVAETPVQQLTLSPVLDNYQLIKIERKGEPSLIFRRDQSQWSLQYKQEMTTPLQANLWKLKQIVDALSQTDYQVLEGELELAQFDLHQPLVALQLDNRKISFGNTNPISRKRYIAIDDKVYLIKDDIYRHVIDDWYEFVAKSLFDESKKITSIAINDVKAVLSQDHGWKIQGSNKEPDMEQILAFIDAWQHTQAVLLTTPEKRKFNFNIDISFKDGDIYHYLATKENDALIVLDQSSKLEYHFSTATTKQLLKFQ